MYGSETDDDNTSTSVGTSQLPSTKPNIPPEIRPRSSITKPAQAVVIPSVSSEAKVDEKKESEATKKTVTASDLRAMTSSPSLENTAETQEGEEREEELEVEGTQFIGVHEFHAENQGDLSVEVGEQLTLLATRSDGWWKCQNSRGEVGLVPKNVLQHVPEPPHEPSNVEEDVYATIEKPSERHPSMVFPDPPQSYVEKELKKKYGTLQPSASASLSTQKPQGDPGVPSSIEDNPNDPDPQVTQGPSSAVESQDTRASKRSKRSQKSVEQETPQQLQQQFKLLKVDKNDHYGLICHLFPRLSESNLYFHDLYWLWNPSDRSFKIRKRKVKFCKTIKVYGIGPQEFQMGFDIRFYLFDKRNATGRQIVSNIITDRVRVDQSDSFSFFKSDSCSFVLRSNYNLSDVVLRAEVYHQGNLLGYADTILLSPSKVPVQNMKYTLPILKEDGTDSKNTKLVVNIQDVPSALVTAADSLPDVLLCRENRILTYSLYRNLLAENIATRASSSSTTWISDPVIATFPIVATDPDLMDFLTEELTQKKGFRSTALFRQIYINSILPIAITSPFPEDRKLRKHFLETYSDSLRKNKSGVEFVSVMKSKPVDPFDFVVDLTSTHALD